MNWATTGFPCCPPQHVAVNAFFRIGYLLHYGIGLVPGFGASVKTIFGKKVRPVEKHLGITEEGHRVDLSRFIGVMAYGSRSRDKVI